MTLFTLDDLEAAAELVYGVMQPTPQLAWPLLRKRAGCDVVVKHENHTPTGAFKVRGGLVYMDRLKQRMPDVPGVTSATRGNHGQSIAFAASRHGLRSAIHVPEGNSVEKNAAMAAFGAELTTIGRDFDEAREACARTADKQGLHFVPFRNGVFAVKHHFFMTRRRDTIVRSRGSASRHLGIWGGLCLQAR